jgi:hypothetical protein
MRKHLFLAFVLTALFLTGKGQQIYFDSIYQIKGNRCQIGWNVLADQNDFLIAGITTDSVYDYTRFFIAKLDSTGNKIWEKSYGEALNHFYCTGTNSLIKTNDDNYALCMGEYFRDIDKIRIMLVKFDNVGDTLWTKRYNYNHYNEAYQCKQTKDHGYIVIGASDSTDAANHADMTMIKTDSLGNLEWQKYYHKTGTERAMSMDLMNDGGYLIGGWRYNIINAAEIIRTDSVGNVKWSSTYGSSYGAAGTAVKKLKDGSYVIGYGNKISYDGGSTIYSNLTLKRLNNNNQEIWTKTYGQLYNSGGFNAITEKSNGDIVAVGDVCDSITDHLYSLILIVDTAGVKKHFAKYDRLPAINAQNYLYDVKATKDNGFIASGFCVGSGSPQYCWVVKVDSVGCQIPFCNVGIEEEIKVYNGFMIYPNPARSEITLKFDKSFEKDVIVSVFNSLGEIVIKQKMCKTESDVRFDIARLQAGIYFVKVNGYSGKFIKQ